MNGWKQGWIIFKRDLYTDRMYLIWSVVFMVYTGAMIAILIMGKEVSTGVFNPFVDFMLLLLIPLTGFYFSRRSFNYIKDDSYTKMLWYYRTLPILIDSVMKARVIQLLAAVAGNSLILYTTLYLASNFMRSNLGIGEMIVFAITWSGFAIFSNAFYIYFELLASGRKYLWITFVIMFSTALFSVLSYLLNYSLFTSTISVSREYGLLSPYMWGTMVLGLLLLNVMTKVVGRRLSMRDLRQ
ncbi:hypothetical protein D3C77_336340 [compost metagenome]